MASEAYHTTLPAATLENLTGYTVTHLGGSERHDYVRRRACKNNEHINK